LHYERHEQNNDKQRLKDNDLVFQFLHIGIAPLAKR
jgi:hypothetical protein